MAKGGESAHTANSIPCFNHLEGSLTCLPASSGSKLLICDHVRPVCAWLATSGVSP